jgi:hypothetical protein
VTDFEDIDIESALEQLAAHFGAMEKLFPGAHLTVLVRFDEPGRNIVLRSDDVQLAIEALKASGSQDEVITPLRPSP